MQGCKDKKRCMHWQQDWGFGVRVPDLSLTASRGLGTNLYFQTTSCQVAGVPSKGCQGPASKYSILKIANKETVTDVNGDDERSLLNTFLVFNILFYFYCLLF